MSGNQKEDELDQVLFEGNKVEQEKQAKNFDEILQQQSDEDEDSSDDDDDLEIILDGGTDGNTQGGSSLFQSGAVGLVQSGMSANMQKSNLQSSSGGGQSSQQQQHSLDGKSLQQSSAQSHIQQSQQQSQSQQPAMDEVIPIRRGMINIDGIGIHRDKPILDFNIDLDIPDSEKGWMKPGADVTDYFNYGFTEDTWRLYCIKQRELRDELAINKKSVFDRAAILKEYQQKIGSSSSGGKQTGDSAQVDSRGDYQQQKQYQQDQQRDVSQSQRGSDYRHHQHHYAQQDHVSKSRERKRSRDVSRHSYGGRATSAGDVRDYSQTRDKRYKVDYDNQTQTADDPRYAAHQYDDYYYQQQAQLQQQQPPIDSAQYQDEYRRYDPSQDYRYADQYYSQQDQQQHAQYDDYYQREGYYNQQYDDSKRR
ncbi:hypothetical protein MP228_009334 [Amoeboaphelidium protococcarum]|nr:hypothetical protein MP228_009334 [Amoeboaphelidium protococcarum]